MDDLVHNHGILNYDFSFFEKNGFWVSPVLIDESKLKIVRDQFEKVMEGDFSTGFEPYNFRKSVKSGKKTYKLTNSYLSDTILSKLILNEKLGKIAANLLRAPKVRYWRDHLWKKPAGSSKQSNVGWHQDYLYWQSADPANLLTAWIALDDSTVESGCIHYVPGSHKWGLLDAGDLYSPDMFKLEQSYKNLSGRNFTPVPCEMRAGMVVFHHCLTIHGSFANHSPSPRRSISIHYMPDGTKYKADTGIKPFSNAQLFGGEDGEHYAGPHFPVIYSRNEKMNPWH